MITRRDMLKTGVATAALTTLPAVATARAKRGVTTLGLVDIKMVSSWDVHPPKPVKMKGYLAADFRNEAFIVKVPYAFTLEVSLGKVQGLLKTRASCVVIYDFSQIRRQEGFSKVYTGSLKRGAMLVKDTWPSIPTFEILKGAIIIQTRLSDVERVVEEA
jgi:hypothetical protein